MSQAGMERSHRLRCSSKIPFGSDVEAHRYARALEWAFPDNPALCGMEAFECTACGDYHIGHSPSRGVGVIRSRP